MTEQPPYAAYAGIMSTFLGGVALTGLLARKLRRTPTERTAFDLAVLGLATFKAARTLAGDDVTSFISWSLAVGGANDWLQAGFAALTGAANRVQQ